ncbi:hypothetical protein HDU76_001141, partial [Blyttiomyces sp. JEL0837]
MPAAFFNDPQSKVQHPTLFLKTKVLNNLAKRTAAAARLAAGIDESGDKSNAGDSANDQFDTGDVDILLQDYLENSACVDALESMDAYVDAIVMAYHEEIGNPSLKVDGVIAADGKEIDEIGWGHGSDCQTLTLSAQNDSN